MASGVLHSDCSYTHIKGIFCEINEIKGLRAMQNVCVCLLKLENTSSLVLQYNRNNLVIFT